MQPRRRPIGSLVPPFTSYEEVSLKVMSIMKEAYGSLPMEFRGLSKSADLLAPRGFVVSNEDSLNAYRRRHLNARGRFPIVYLCIASWNTREPLFILPGVRAVDVGCRAFNCDLILGEGVEVVKFSSWSSFNKPLDLPNTLRELALGESYDWPIVVPLRLEELLFAYKGVFNHPLTLPEKSSLKTLQLPRMFNRPINLVEGLESLGFGKNFNVPVTLPSTLKELEFSEESVFNHQIELPNGLKSASFGEGMTQAVDLPCSLEKLVWRSDVCIHLHEGLEEVKFGLNFDEQQQLTHLPSTLRKITFHESYKVELELPPRCSRYFY